MMKGRADDRRLFDRHLSLNVLAMVDSTNLDAELLVENITLSDFTGLGRGTSRIWCRFSLRPQTFGSLIQVPERPSVESLAAMKDLSKSTQARTFL